MKKKNEAVEIHIIVEGSWQSHIRIQYFITLLKMIVAFNISVI